MGWIAQQFDRLQVASRTACPHDPEDGLNKPTILGHNTPVTGLAWQALLTFPLVGTQHLSVHSDSAQKSGYNHHSTAGNSPYLSY